MCYLKINYSFKVTENASGKKKNEGVSGGIHGYCVQDIQKIMEYGFLKVVVVFQRIFTVCCGL